MSCNGLNSPVGSHQRCAERAELGELGRVGVVEWAVIGEPIQPAERRFTSPATFAATASDPARSGRARRARRYRAVSARRSATTRSAGDPDVGHLIATGDVHQVRNRIVAGACCYRAQVDGDRIGLACRARASRCRASSAERACRRSASPCCSASAAGIAAGVAADALGRAVPRAAPRQARRGDCYWLRHQCPERR